MEDVPNFASQALNAESLIHFTRQYMKTVGSNMNAFYDLDYHYGWDSDKVDFVDEHFAGSSCGARSSIANQSKSMSDYIDFKKEYELGYAVWNVNNRYIDLKRKKFAPKESQQKCFKYSIMAHERYMYKQQLDIYIQAWTPLLVAAQNGHKEAVEVLLLAKANIEAANNGGATPLYVAAQNGHKEAVEVLLRAKANIEAANNDGATPLYVAAQNGHKGVMQNLTTAGANVHKALHFAARHDDTTAMQNLTTAGSKVEERTGKRRWVLDAESLGYDFKCTSSEAAECPECPGVNVLARLEVKRLLVDTEVQGVVFALGLDGQHIGLDCAEALSRKLEFISREVEPFQGIRMLQNLAQANLGVGLPAVPLLLALEMHCLDYPEDAAPELATYLSVVQAGATPSHPWLLLALARLRGGWHRALYLRAFGLLCPTAVVEPFLTPEEAMLAVGSVPPLLSRSASPSSPSAAPCAQEQWDAFKRETGATSGAMEKLLVLTGLPRVKEQGVGLFKRGMVLSKLSDDLRQRNPVTLNYAFVGNPGTGKTTVARLFAGILCDSGMRCGAFEQVTAQAAKDGGIDEFRKRVEAAMGGVLFIDEAYALDPGGDFKGKPIVNEILTLCGDKRDSISVILAGYEDDIETKLYAHNGGLRSRFQTATFDDFDKADLTSIWTSIFAKKGWVAPDEGLTKVLVARVARLAGKKGFGNARTLDQRFDEASTRALSRHDFDKDRMEMRMVDVIGRRPSENEKLQAALAELEKKTGWARVKSAVRELVDLANENYDRELRGKKPSPVLLNRMFLGNPGTGKTTCAHLYGRILKCLGFLSRGDVLPKTASHFGGSVVGEAQKLTVQILEAAKGKVLVIDEAYSLNDGAYGKQVLDTLVEKVQGTESDDIAVLLIGYEDQMKQMLREQNPGLGRRFNADYAFRFDDYSDRELLTILQHNLKANDRTATMTFCQQAIKELGAQRVRGGFGNAGAVKNLVASALQKAAARGGEARLMMSWLFALFAPAPVYQQVMSLEGFTLHTSYFSLNGVVPSRLVAYPETGWPFLTPHRHVCSSLPLDRHDCKHTRPATIFDNDVCSKPDGVHCWRVGGWGAGARQPAGVFESRWTCSRRDGQCCAEGRTEGGGGRTEGGGGRTEGGAGYDEGFPYRVRW